MKNLPEDARTETTVRSGARYRVASGAVWSFIRFGLAMLLALPVTVLLVRSMAPTQYGILAVATTIIALSSALTGLGLNTAVAQMAASARAEDQGGGVLVAAKSGLVIAAGVALITVVLAPPLVLVLRMDHTLRSSAVVVGILLPTVVFTPFVAVFSGLLQAAFEARKATVVNTVSAAATAALSATAVLVGRRSAVDIALARALGILILVVGLGWCVRHWWLQAGAGKNIRSDHRRLLPFALAMLLSAIVWTAISQLDVLFVGIERGFVAASLYAPISRVADFEIGFAALFAGYLLPAMVAAKSQATSAVRDLYHWSSRWSFVICAPMLGLLLVAPSQTVEILFGTRFSGVTLPARLLGVAAAIHIAFGFNGLTLDAFGLARPVAVRSGAGIVASAVCCPVLIPLFGLTGAALSTLVAIVVVNALSSWALLKRFGIWPWDTRLAATIGAFMISLGMGRLALLAGDLGHVVDCATILICSGLVTLGTSVIVGGRGEISTVVGRFAGRRRAGPGSAAGGAMLGAPDLAGPIVEAPGGFPTIEEEGR
jgi:O-antigen/teichoic acid export membrane protein